MDDFETLVANCKASVTLTVNDHRDSYQSVAEYLSDVARSSDGELDDLPDDVRAEMVKRNTVVHLQFYPDTPTGSYWVWHYSVREAVRKALEIING